MSPDLEQIAKDLRARYKNDLSRILFFGSRARGEATSESDYDCLLIFRKLTEDLKQDLDRLASEWLLNRGIVFSCIALNESDLEGLRYEPFLQNAFREGIAA